MSITSFCMMGRDAKPNGMLYLFKVCPLGLSLQAVVWQHSLWGLSFCVYMNTFGKWRFWDLYSFLVMRASLGSINAMLTFKAHALGMGCLPTLVTDMAECQIKYWFKTSVACSQCVYGGTFEAGSGQSPQPFLYPWHQHSVAEGVGSTPAGWLGIQHVFAPSWLHGSPPE